MKSQVIFYGNVQKAGTVLACVQAAISDCNRTRRSAYSAGIIDRYVAELEEIEVDLVALINTARADPHIGNSGQSLDPESPSDGDVHEF